MPLAAMVIFSVSWLSLEELLILGSSDEISSARSRSRLVSTASGPCDWSIQIRRHVLAPERKTFYIKPLPKYATRMSAELDAD